MQKLALVVVILTAALSQVCADMATTSISVNAGNSVGTIEPLWRDFAEGGESPDSDFLTGSVSWMKPLSPRLIRNDSGLCAFSSVKVDPSGNLITDFSKLDQWIDICNSTGAKPMICIAYGAGFAPLSDLKLWEELVYQYVKHVNIDRKYGVKYWEVWNEPNLQSFWSGTKEQYFELYAATVRGALRADPTIKIGGGGFAMSAGQWVCPLIDYAKANNLRLDFVSWHDYGVPPQFYKEFARRVQGWLQDRGMKAELFITEWNWFADLDPGNDNEQGAAYVACSLHNMINSPLDHAQFFEVKDGWKQNMRYWGRWGLVTIDDHPKAVYYVYKAFTMLGTDRVRMTGGINAVNGIATRKDGKLRIILYNFGGSGNWPSWPGSKGPVKVYLTINGLPSGRLVWQRYLIDENHSNPVRQKNDSSLQKVEDQVVESQKGVIMTPVTLAKNAVTLISIEPAVGRKDKISRLASLTTRNSTLKPPKPAFVCPFVNKAPVVDGKLGDWSKQKVSIGSGERSANIRFAWNHKALYVGIEVKDPEQVQHQVGSEIWNGDSIQIGFDPLCDALPGETYGNDDFEYGFALTSKGPITWCWECPGWKSTGPVSKVKLAVDRNDAAGITTYEAMIPWSELELTDLSKTGKPIRIGVLVNDINTGTDRQTIEWGGGISVAKQPVLFRAVVLGR